VTGRLSVWPPLPPGAHLRPAGAAPPFPLSDPRCRVYARARHGVYHGVRALGLGPGDEVLVPAFHHGSEVEALARAGLRCRFYDGDEALAPDEGELEGLLGPRVRALYLTHFLGFPQDGARWRAWADRRGLLLIEDGAMAWLAERDGRPAGVHGDLAVWCLYKTVGVPDGGAAVASAPLPAPGPASLGAPAVVRRHGAWLAARWGLVGSRRAGQAGAPYDPEADFALGDAASAPVRLTRRLLPRLADPGVAAARRAGYHVMFGALGELVPPPFAELPGGASPFVFPIAVSGKAAAVRRLAELGIDALALWSAPHPSLDAGAFPRAGRLRETVVGLPVHQELRPQDLARIVRVVRQLRSRW